MARAGGGGGGGGGWSSRHPQFARGRRLPALLPAPGKGAASPQPGAGGVRSASQRIPPAPSAALLSPPEPCAALEVRWAVAGRDGQRSSPMGGRRGQRGAGPFCRWQGQAPARRPPSPPSPPPPSLPPGAPRPASRLSLFLPPGSRRSGARRGWSRVAPAGPASPLLSQGTHRSRQKMNRQMYLTVVRKQSPEKAEFQLWEAMKLYKVGCIMVKSSGCGIRRTCLGIQQNVA
ncbi:cuticle collagen 40-like [Neofelis nebulosa]|uniref:cuticle collagen 40-like n=1 Tax=Neofelis nebulosa TaxID=61452 RepID=UPI00272D03E0|nr:cuticle collagen 40-like [Neofelis nebulosa]